MGMDFKFVFKSKGAWLLAFCLAQENLRAETFYVQSVKAALKEGPQAGAKDLAELPRGEAVEVSEKQGLWYAVTVNGKKGWVNRLTVSATKPVGKAELQQKLETVSLEKSSRKRPSGSADTVASTRAVLASGERKRGEQEQYNSDFEAVDQMEKSKIKTDDVEKFIKSGSLNP
jgi:uncharacterized protein YgiM (DUF1202 family)